MTSRAELEQQFIDDYRVQWLRRAMDEFGAAETLAMMTVRTFLGWRYRQGVREISPGDISKETGLSPSTITKVVAEFIEDGMLREEVDPDDRRRRILRPGPNAEAETESWDAWHREFVDAMLQKYIEAGFLEVPLGPLKKAILWFLGVVGAVSTGVVGAEVLLDIDLID